MAKAILVVDMPDSCFHCQLELYGNQCGANYKNTAGNANKRPSWCPLKPLPPHEKALMFGSEFEMFSEKVGEIVLDAIEETDETDTTETETNQEVLHGA